MPLQALVFDAYGTLFDVHSVIAECERLFGAVPVKIGAQQYLEKFYQGFGFEQCGDMYLEDGIPHIPMLRLGLPF